ncbi:DUF7344 domain-containing protein [Halopiger xanaduensis]
MLLYHTHIPKLEEAGIVTYDQERDIVTLAEQVEHIKQYQDLLTVD